MPTAGLHAFDVELEDSVRGLCRSLRFRTARHPSESPERLAARALAFCLEFEEGLAFSPGLSTRDVPALWRRDADALRVRGAGLALEGAWEELCRRGEGA